MPTPDREPISCNGGFWDLDTDSRDAIYDRAESETGRNFFDLDPEERGHYYDMAEDYR